MKLLTLKDFDRFMRPIKRKILHLVSRSILTLVTNDKGGGERLTQLIQIKGLRGGKDDGGNSDIPRMQPYGLESYPYADGESECINLNMDGITENAVNILVHNRKKRPKDLVEGEVCVYSEDSDKQGNSTNRITFRPDDDEIEIKTKDDNIITINPSGIVIEDTNGNIFTLDSNGIIIEDLNGNTTTMDSSGIVMEDLNGNDVTMQAGKVSINGNNLEVQT